MDLLRSDDPNHVEMNKDMTVKDRTEEDWKNLEEMIEAREKELISLPVSSYDLSNHYRFDEKIALDGETVLTPQEALEEFMYSSYPFQIFGQAEEFLGACDAVNRIQAYGLNNNLYKTIFISSEISRCTCPSHLVYGASCHYQLCNASK